MAAAFIIALAGIGLALFVCAVSYIGHANCDTVCHTSLLAASPIAALAAGLLAVGVFVSACLRLRSAVVLMAAGVVVCWLLWLATPGLGH